MTNNKSSNKKGSKDEPAKWVRGGFRVRHKVSDSDIAEAVRPENLRVAISIKVPLDVLEFFKNGAEQSGVPYQTQINRLLRTHVEEQRANSGNGGSLRAAARSARSAVDHLLETLKRIDQRASR